MNEWFALDRLLGLTGLLYILRIPILLFLIASFVTWGGLSSTAPGATFLRGIFDVAWPPSATETHAVFKTGIRFFLVTLNSMMFAATLAVCSRNLIRCSKRFGILDVLDEDLLPNIGLRLLYTLPPLALAAAIIIGVTVTTTVNHWLAAAGDAIGLVAFAGFFLITSRFRGSFNRSYYIGVSIVIVLGMVGSAIAFFAFDWNPGAMLFLLLSLILLLQAVRASFPADASNWHLGSPIGYYDEFGKLDHHHLLAIHALSVVMQIYCAIFLFKSASAHKGLAEYPMVPTLSVLLILAIVTCWSICTLTFFLDHYRIPVVFPLVVTVWFTSSFPQADHFFRVFDADPELRQLRLTPGELLDAECDRPPPVLVATTGGGILASSWSARALRDLQLATGDQERFLESIRLISAVSGGSVGAMYFVNAYGNAAERQVSQGPADDRLRDDPVLAHAQASSLDDIAVELAYQDLVLNLFPYLRGLDYQRPSTFRVLNGRAVFLDRGKALEDALKRGPSQAPLFGKRLDQARLLDWKQDARHGLRPAVIFNATVVETGQRMLFSTTDLDPPGRPAPGGRLQFHDDANVDIPVTTGVRLSATFPFVSPAARAVKADVFERSNHIVDGGYSDNFGMASLVEWLDSGLRELKGNGKHLPRKILIIELRSSAQRDPSPGNNQSGFTFQALHPAKTLWNVRETGQLSHNELERDLVTRRWAEEEVSICSVVFQPPPSDRVEPLNWHLTIADQIALKKAWDKQLQGSIDLVRQHVKGENYTCE